MPHHTLPPAIRKRLRAWLILCMAMVAMMVFVGGLTRLTESGLSMVEWKPLHLLPPIGEAQWAEEFAKYRASPEYLKVNNGMSVEGFRHIFWLEYIHRLLGRLVGFVFFLPLLYFGVRHRLPRPLLLRYLGIFALGGMQGAIGWIMVKSGLQDQPWVSPVKLGLHLCMAFAIFGLLLWQVLRLSNSIIPAQAGTQPDDLHTAPHTPHSMRSAAPSRQHSASSAECEIGAGAEMPCPASWSFMRGAYYATLATAALVYLEIFLGALVAGRDAGMIYNTYPKMDEDWVPDSVANLSPLWRNAFENIATIQFDHRVLAHLVVLAVLSLTIALWRIGPDFLGRALLLLPFALFLQFALGVLTLLHQVPIPLASAHQMGALLLFALCITLIYRLKMLLYCEPLAAKPYDKSPDLRQNAHQSGSAPAQ